MSMSFVCMVEAELPPGFRFHPRDDELIREYLAPKVFGRIGFSGYRPPMVDVDLNKVEPWDLPRTALVGPREWYFFSQTDRKYATGQRRNRATASGYWKATGKDRVVQCHGMLLGMRKTLVFYSGRAPKGRKTEWVMHEYRMEVCSHEQSSNITNKGDWVLCKVICKKKSSEGANFKARGLATDGHGTTTVTSPPLQTLMGITLAQVQAAMAMPRASLITTTANSNNGQEEIRLTLQNSARNNNIICVEAAQQPRYLPVVTDNAKGQHDEMGSYTDPITNCDKDLLTVLLRDLGGEVVPSLPPEMTESMSSCWMSNHF